MSRSGRISVKLPSQHLSQIRRVVDAGEYASAAAVMREALRAWLHRRALHAGAHGAQRFSRTLEARHEAPIVEPAERVELLFDAGDAKA
jgi:Arc/MetJ-type ribon-helix-helix transcriptional regulator